MRRGDVGHEVFGDNLSNELGMMGLLIAAVRAHKLLAIPSRRRSAGIE